MAHSHYSDKWGKGSGGGVQVGGHKGAAAPLPPP